MSRGVPAGANRPNQVVAVVARQSGLADGRNSGTCGSRFSLPMPRILILPAWDGGSARLTLTDHQVDVAADHVVQRGRGAAIVHRQDLDARHVLEQRDVHVRRRADAGGAVGDLAGLLLGQLDQLLDVRDRQVLLASSAWLMRTRPVIGMKSFFSSYSSLPLG